MNRLSLFSMLLLVSSAKGRELDGVFSAFQPSEKALSVLYDPDTGGVQVVLNSGDQAPMKMMTSLLIESNDVDFAGTKPETLTGPFDVFRADRLFKMDPKGFGPTVDLGTPLETGINADLLMHSLAISGSILGGGSIEDLPMYLVHPAAIPEPSSMMLLLVGLGLIKLRSRRIA